MVEKIRRFSRWLNQRTYRIVLYYSFFLLVAFQFILKMHQFEKIQLAITVGVAVGIFHAKVMGAKDMAIHKRFFWALVILLCIAAVTWAIEVAKSLLLA